MNAIQSQLQSIKKEKLQLNRTVKRFIVLCAPNDMVAKKVLAWWDNTPNEQQLAAICDDLRIKNLENDT